MVDKIWWYRLVWLVFGLVVWQLVDWLGWVGGMLRPVSFFWRLSISTLPERVRRVSILQPRNNWIDLESVANRSSKCHTPRDRPTRWPYSVEDNKSQGSDRNTTHVRNKFRALRSWLTAEDHQREDGMASAWRSLVWLPWDVMDDTRSRRHSRDAYTRHVLPAGKSRVMPCPWHWRTLSASHTNTWA